MWRLAVPGSPHITLLHKFPLGNAILLKDYGSNGQAALETDSFARRFHIQIAKILRDRRNKRNAGSVLEDEGGRMAPQLHLAVSI
jgi:hypothetical protein